MIELKWSLVVTADDEKQKFTLKVKILYNLKLCIIDITRI